MADVTGTGGNDLLTFSGVTQTLSMTIVNAYSGKTLLIDDEYNVNSSSYEGLAGIDTLLMSNRGDAIFITNGAGQQMIFNMETIIAGAGGDLIKLDHGTITLGDMTIDGGTANDILWANAGNDTIRGAAGDDIIDGGPGNDNLQGQGDNDIISGGTGADWLQGGDGNDILEFTVDEIWGAGYSTFNPYSGAEAALDGLKRTNDTFDGGAGSDTITMSDYSEALILDDPVSARHALTSGARIALVETINAGGGNDVINLASTNYSYGNVTINGGAGNDVLWSGAGADVLNGDDGDDHLHGGAGNDILAGGAGTDHLDGGAGDDILHFSGNEDTYIGGTGVDTLVLRHGGDSLAFNGTNLSAVEIIAGGDGDDTIMLDHAVSYGAVTVDGGAGNDMIRSSAGDDVLRGGDGDDTIFGNLGNDRIEGGAGNDILYGGDETGPIRYSHDFSNQTVFPTLTERKHLNANGQESLGIADGDLRVEYQTTASLKFVESGAGYKNSLGFYSIAADGTIQAVEMAFKNMHAVTPGQTYTVNLPGAPDTDFGFFIIADGFSTNNSYSGLNFTTGELAFVYKHGTGAERAAKITDSGADISLVYTNGAVTRVLNGPVYHTTDRDGSTALNKDGEEHVVSGLLNAGDDSVLRIGFEDLPCLGDEDYNDVVFDLSIAPATVGTGQVGDDILIGGAGSDILYGGGGADDFVFTHLGDGVDTVMDFNMGEGDRLNITDILENFDSLTDAITDFVRLVQQGGDTVLEVNADGMGSDFAAAAIIHGGLGGATLANLISAGALVTDQSLVA